MFDILRSEPGCDERKTKKGIKIDKATKYHTDLFLDWVKRAQDPRRMFWSPCRGEIMTKKHPRHGARKNAIHFLIASQCWNFSVWRIIKYSVQSTLKFGSLRCFGVPPTNDSLGHWRFRGTSSFLRFVHLKSSPKNFYGRVRFYLSTATKTFSLGSCTVELQPFQVCNGS